MMSGRRLFRPRLASAAGTVAGAGAAAAPAGRSARFREIMLPHLDAAYSFARYLARDATAAEDIVQEAFLRAFRSFDTYRGEAAKAWLFAIVRNCFLASVAIRQRHLREAGPDTISQDENVSPCSLVDDHDPETILMANGEIALLRTTLAGLPEPFRETLVLRGLEELSYKDIAVMTGVPIGTVMSRLARGREILRTLLLPAVELGR